MERLRIGDPVEMGPYRLLGWLGAGGFGEVFLGCGGDEELAAVTVVRADYAANPRFRARLAREVARVCTVRTPWVAAVLGADTDTSTPWLAREYVAGPSLGQVVSTSGPLPETVVGVLGARLGGALAQLHTLGVTHGDLKPSNVLLAADGPRLIDFAIVRALDSDSVTLVGGAFNSPAFMSPEQANGEDGGRASDVFSLASVLVYAATAQGPFGETANPVAMLRWITDQHPDLSRVPHALGRVLQACLVKRPDVRPTAAELVERLALWADVPLAEAWPSSYQDLWIKSF